MKRISRDHSVYCIIKIDHNTEKIPGDLKTLADIYSCEKQSPGTRMKKTQGVTIIILIIIISKIVWKTMKHK